MNYEAVIGLEIHIQLKTKSKLFSSSPNLFGCAVNENTNELDLGYPGTLPVLNREAAVCAALFGRAIGAHINPHAFFMRKNYFYPDLPKGYQISQLDDAIIQGGEIVLEMGDYQRKVRINRGQLEEDAGKSVHDAFSDRTGIDLNRAGVPLIELVTEPDMRSAAEAVAFMRKIHHLVRYLGISDGNMQEGSFRCDANVSIRPKGSETLNPRVELKNINSFRFVEQAIGIEIERQSECMDAGHTVAQETRLFDPERQETRTMRSKEEANDYRYFPDPDLLPLDLDEAFWREVQTREPEFPEARAQRYQTQHGLTRENCDFILQSLELAQYFDELVAEIADAKLALNWLQGEFWRLYSEDEVFKVSAPAFAELLRSVEKGEIAQNVAKKLLAQMWESGASAAELIAAQGLRQINDDQAIETWVDEVIAENPKQVEAFRGGQSKMLGFFVGQVLKRSQGKANPKVVGEWLQKKLK